MAAKKKPLGIVKKKAVKKPSETSSLELHEQICAIRYENIERRLEAGASRFVRMEASIYGLYAAIIGLYLLEKLI